MLLTRSWCIYILGHCIIIHTSLHVVACYFLYIYFKKNQRLKERKMSQKPSWTLSCIMHLKNFMRNYKCMYIPLKFANIHLKSVNYWLKFSMVLHRMLIIFRKRRKPILCFEITVSVNLWVVASLSRPLSLFRQVRLTTETQHQMCFNRFSN